MLGGAMMGWLWIWPALVLIGLGLLGYVGVRTFQGRTRTPAGSVSARRSLDERFARGEIDEQEYRRRRDGLS
ncbi:SHOCT domain-containing protein [Pseudonocardia sp. T1-2H]|uniref:SHOCT domain-containing protein n=1 Tax=Pseudonocardia sp. T1-2H TaxID=3128899 RepID=UPI003101009E